jgi:iron complex outermembrane receptor protein
LRKDSLLGATLDNRFGDDVYLKTTAYHHSNEGQGHWYTPYTPSTNGCQFLSAPQNIRSAATV